MNRRSFFKMNKVLKINLLEGYRIEYKTNEILLEFKSYNKLRRERQQ